LNQLGSKSDPRPPFDGEKGRIGNPIKQVGTASQILKKAWGKRFEGKRGRALNRQRKGKPKSKRGVKMFSAPRGGGANLAKILPKDASKGKKPTVGFRGMEAAFQRTFTF